MAQKMATAPCSSCSPLTALIKGWSGRLHVPRLLGPEKPRKVEEGQEGEGEDDIRLVDIDTLSETSAAVSSLSYPKSFNGGFVDSWESSTSMSTDSQSSSSYSTSGSEEDPREGAACKSRRREVFWGLLIDLEKQRLANPKAAEQDTMRLEPQDSSASSGPPRLHNLVSL
eukprot:CAMPEP_0197900330 /NCGR_PEP_ID=MMETSP1439-20131203/48837_1 /TAXON_ID=66791 /ORGANISM="Gonyaulax spinifera, Strain CCMP409" /LENGTH=169 /DNA_ID=CAMNT_0043521203 /DNA_START=35 /DNA_END=544 /DNA_ORIENTATION=-